MSCKAGCCGNSSTPEDGFGTLKNAPLECYELTFEGRLGCGLQIVIALHVADKPLRPTRARKDRQALREPSACSPGQALTLANIDLTPTNSEARDARSPQNFQWPYSVRITGACTTSIVPKVNDRSRG